MTRVVAVVGPRRLEDWATVRPVLDRLDWTDVGKLISGGASGVDTLAKRYAREVLRWPCEFVVDASYAVGAAMARPYPGFVEISPNYSLYLSKSAPFRRNETIAKLCTELHAIVPAHWGNTGGTAHVVVEAEGLGRLVRVHQGGAHG